MKIYEYSENAIRKIKKAFISPEGEVYATDELGVHEFIARDICNENNWNPLYAGDYIIKKGYIKIANYEYNGQNFRYIAVGRRAIKRKEVNDNLEFINSVLGLKVVKC